MARPMKELVLMRKHEAGRFRIRMTSRKAWGICYGAHLRTMHVAKLDRLPLDLRTRDGTPDSVNPVVDVQFDLGRARTIHVDMTGVWVHYGLSYGDVTEPASDEMVEELVSLARWYGPFDQRTYEKFLYSARPHEVPHVRMSRLLQGERQWFAELGVHGPMFVTEVG